MTRKCTISNDVADKIVGEILGILFDGLLNSTPNAQVKQQVISYLRNLSDIYATSDKSIRILRERFEEVGILVDPSVFPVDEMETIIKDGKNAEFTVNNDNSTAKLEEADRNRSIKEAKNDFLIKAYGTATEVRLAAEHSAAIALFNKIVIDRENNEKVEGEDAINDNLRHYQQELLNIIKDYIVEKNKKSGTNSDIWDDIQIYEDVNGVLTYTGKIHELESEIMKALSHDSFPDEILNDYFVDTKNNYKQKALKAYNAWQILSHFDTFVQLRYGKSLEIHNFGDMYFTGENKYRKANKGANNKTTWRTTEEIILSDEIDKIVQEMVVTTPMYSYGSETPMTDAYLTFNSFCQVIGKLKDMGWKAGNVKFDFDNFNSQAEESEAQLSGRSMGILAGESIQSVINRIRENPTKYLSAIFEALSNKYWYNKLSESGILSDFNKEEKDVIYTIHKGLTGTNNQHSIASIDNSLFGQLAQAADSIFTVKFLQYYTGLDDETKVRSMSDDRLDGIIRSIKQSITTKNSKLNPEHYVVHSDGTATLRGNIEIIPNRKADGKLDSIVIKIPNTKIEATVTIDGRVTFKRNSKNFTTFSKAEAQNFSELCDFVTEITGQNINSQIIELMSNKNTRGQVEANSFSETEKNLVSLACRTVFLSYVSNSDFGNINSKSQLKKKIRGVFGSQSISINTNMREIDLVHSSDIYTITSLANAIAISRGLYASSVIKSGDGSSYSVQSLSRLIGSMRQQMELQNKQPDSASNHLLILDPDVFKGVYTAREYYDLTRSTDHTDFSVKEFGSAMFMQDFIGGLCDNSDQFNPLVGNGVISILPSVNSDKNTIGRIIIDTRKTVKIDGKDIQIRALTIPQFEQFICSELGQLYKKILLRTDEDWGKLMAFAGDRILSKPQSRLSLTGENQAGKYNNEWFFAQLNNECALKTKYIDPVSGKESYLTWSELVALNPNAESYEFLGKTYNKGEKPKVLYDTANVVNNLIKEYNLANRDAPISFTDQVHFIEEKDGSISTNSVLQGYQERFSSPEKLHEFFQNKNADILGTLLRNNFKVDLTDNSRQSKYVLNYFEEYKKNTGIEWVNQKEGEMIIGKVSLGDENNPILVKDIRAKHHLDNFYFDLRTDKYEETETKTKSKSKKKAEPKVIFKSPLSRINEMLDSGLEEDGETSLTLERRNKLEHIKEAITHKQLLYEPQYLIDLKEFGVNFELNPLIDQYNHLDYLFSQEFMASTVGSLIAHPAKGALNNSLEAQEAARFNAQHKRNVSYTAAMQEFALNLLDGIPSDYNIAVVKDVYDLVGNVTGNEDSVKPYDGATFVNPFIVYLENNSLGAAKAGITKKQFVHFYDEHTATGGIIKTCGFGLTNDWMRNSPRLQAMMRKMTNGVWINKFRNDVGDIVEALVDITHNYKGQEIGYNPIYFRKNGKYYTITSIENSGNNYYNIKGVEVNVDTKPGLLQARYEGESDQEINLNSLFNESGNPQDAVLINNNYKLWEVFGGKESLDLVEGQLIPSETSITNVVKAMNSVGVDPRTGRTYNARTDASTISNIQTQEDIYQPLKHSDIHYIATEGAVKQGAANINKADLFDGDEPLNFMRIHMYQAGIQLDKEHHADNSELSLMTQVVNACAHLGYSLTESLSMFNALRSITDTDTAVLLDPIKEYVNAENDTTKTAAREAIVNTVLKAISKQTLQDNDLLRVFADDLITKLKEGGVLKSLDFESKLPIDNPGIYSKFMSSISVFLTKAGIKMKIPGILSVLTPSYEIMRTYQIPVVDGDNVTFRTCKWEQVESYAAQAGQSVQEYLDSIQDIAAPTLTVKDVDLVNDSQTINRSNLRIGRSYVIRTLNEPEQVVKLDSPKKYKTWKKRIFEDPNVVYVAEDIRQGRELGTYDVEFEGYLGDDIQEYSLYDLDSIQRLYDLKDVLDSKDNEQIANFVGSLGDRFVPFIDVDKGTIDIKGVERLLRLDTRHDLAAFSKDGSSFFEDLKDPQLIFVKINGENVRINLSTIKKHAYEIVLPKIFINEFGLETNDLLDEIENDPQFFSRRLALKFTQGLKPSEYDIALKNISGKHWYLSENIGLNQEGLQKVEILKFAEDNKLYWINPSTGDQICELYSDLDEVYRDSQGNYVIVPGEDSSKNISQEEGFKHYIQTLNYSTLQISDDSHVDDDLFKEYVDLIEQCDSKAARWYIRYLKRNNVTAFDLTQDGKTNAELNAQAESDNLNSMRANNTSLSQYTEDALLDPKQADNPITQRLIELGHEIHSSFMKSLEVVASRTPSQSMQSFMPMRIAAFDNPNLNTAHVSTMQIWLQGSDYDVDAVSVAAYAVDKDGRIPVWSPYANLSTLDSLNQSMELPFPTGKKVNIVETELDKLSADERTQAEKQIEDFYVKYLASGLFEPQLKKDGYHLKFTDNLYAIKRFLEEINSTGIPYLTDSLQNKILENEIVKNKLRLGNVKLNIFLDFLTLINKHNLYLTRLSKFKVELISKNKLMHDMYNISNDPINLIQAQAPVDVMTGPLKAEGNKLDANALLGNRTPGNVFNKAESIEDNQVGKDGIGICAVGLKGFFGATTYANMLAKFGENKEEFSRLLLGKDGKGIKIHIPGRGEQIFKYLANVNPQLSLLDGSQAEQTLYKALYESNSDTDAALILSALLSLATDNAKELQLSKLNAGTKTIGMYIYGTAIGMEFSDLVKIMTSDVARMITDLTKGNVFNRERGLFSLDSVFGYLENGPMALLSKYSTPIIHEGKTYASILQQVGSYLKNKMNKEYGEDKRDLNLNQILGKIAWIGKTDELIQEDFKKLKKDEKAKYENVWDYRKTVLRKELNDKIKLLNDMKSAKSLTLSTAFRKSNESATNEERQKFNQCISALQEYVRQVYLVKNHRSTYNSIKQLAEGGEEFRVLGQVLGLNQGLKTKPEELLLKVFSIQNIIQDRYNADSNKKRRWFVNRALSDTTFQATINPTKNKTWNMFDLFKFCTDDNYKADKVREYDKVKHTINILDVAVTVPHFSGYLQTLALAHEACKIISPKYSTIDKLAGNYEEQDYEGWGNKLKVKNSKDLQYLFKGLGNFYSDYVRRAWMIDKNITIDLPAGTNVLVNGELRKVTKSKTILQLGTRDGDASFKYLMDSVIIPTLQAGKTKEDGSELQILKSNKFILNLTTGLITNTATKNPMILYTLPINMMPSSDEEYQIFNTYKSEFNKIRNLNWTFSNGTQIPLVDLFYYYGLIAHYGKQGPQSLMPIFENLHQFKNYKINDFHKYEAAFNEDLNNVEESALLPYILPVKSLYDTHTSKGYAKDPDSMMTILWTKLSKHKSDEYDEYEELNEVLDEEFAPKQTVVNGYVKALNNNLLKSKYVNSYPVVADISRKLETNMEDDLNFEYTSQSGQNYKIKINKKTYKEGKTVVDVIGNDSITKAFIKAHPELATAELTKQVSQSGRNIVINGELYAAAIEEAEAEEQNNCSN